MQVNISEPRNDAEVGMGIPRLIVLHGIVHHRRSIFYKLKVCDSPAWSKSISIIFPTAFAHFVYLRHVLVVRAIFQTFLSLHFSC